MKMLRFFLLLIPIVSGLKINCEYRRDNWFRHGAYVCELETDPKIRSYGTVVTEAKGNHLESLNNEVVNGFASMRKTVHFMPRGLSKVFPDLIGINIFYGGMKELHQNDLKEYENLRVLGLNFNDIEILKKDLFKYNPELELIRLHQNKINQVHPDVFDHLNQLERLDMSDNVCVKNEATAPWIVPEVIQDVKENCTYDDKIIPNVHNGSSKIDLSAIWIILTNVVFKFV